VQKSVLAKERTGGLKNPLTNTTAQRRTTADRVDKYLKLSLTKKPVVDQKQS
jgi:hypothetical protein